MHPLLSQQHSSASYQAISAAVLKVLHWPPVNDAPWGKIVTITDVAFTFLKNKKVGIPTLKNVQ